jgi:hypothetical protein
MGFVPLWKRLGLDRELRAFTYIREQQVTSRRLEITPNTSINSFVGNVPDTDESVYYFHSMKMTCGLPFIISSFSVERPQICSAAYANTITDVYLTVLYHECFSPVLCFL